MSLWGRLLLIALLPFVAVVPVDAYARCTFQPMTCCLPDQEADDACGSCCEETDEEPSEESSPGSPTDCCCVTTVVAETGELREATTVAPMRAPAVRLKRLVGRTVEPTIPPPVA